MSFKFSTEKGIINAIRMSCDRKNQLCFEALKGVNVEDEVEHKRIKGTIKQVPQKEEVNQRIMFEGVEKGVGKMKIMCY